MMKSIKILPILLSCLFLSSTLSYAATVWNYRLQAAGPIKGGKLKISKIKSAEKYVQLKMKYKLETSVGFKEDWIPYNFPKEVFNNNYLNKLRLNSTQNFDQLPHAYENRVVQFQITRKSADAFLLNSDDGKFLIYTRPNGGAWKRIEFVIRAGVTITLKGNLENIVNE